MSIFEERRIRLKQNTQVDTSVYRDFLSLCRGHTWPGIREKGGQITCLLSGVIGCPSEELLLLTRYPDLSSWEESQTVLAGQGEDLVDSENVRLFRPITSRPKEPFPEEDRRPFFTDRRFFIRNRDLDEYAALSEKGVWPLYEAWGCSILGLFTTVAVNRIQEVVLIAGYKSIAHWEETRAINKPRPDKMDEKLWERGTSDVIRRAGLTLRSTVSMMRAVHLPCDL